MRGTTPPACSAARSRPLRSLLLAHSRRAVAAVRSVPLPVRPQRRRRWKQARRCSAFKLTPRRWHARRRRSVRWHRWGSAQRRPRFSPSCLRWSPVRWSRARARRVCAPPSAATSWTSRWRARPKRAGPTPIRSGRRRSTRLGIPPMTVRSCSRRGLAGRSAGPGSRPSGQRRMPSGRPRAGSARRSTGPGASSRPRKGRWGRPKRAWKARTTPGWPQTPPRPLPGLLGPLWRAARPVWGRCGSSSPPTPPTSPRTWRACLQV